MSYRDSDGRLEEALASLPRETVSEQFTTAVLAAIEDRSTTPRSTSVSVGWTAIAAFTVLIAGLVGLAYQRQQAAEERYREQVLELRLEYQHLLAEVANVRHEATEPPTHLYLGGDDRLDLILDLSQPELRAGPGENLPATRDSRQERRNLKPATYEP